jgi:hypothetical protein
MLGTLVLGLIVLSSAISALVIDLYVAKKISSINANLKHNA